MHSILGRYMKMLFDQFLKKKRKESLSSTHIEYMILVEHKDHLVGVVHLENQLKGHVAPVILV